MLASVPNNLRWKTRCLRCHTQSQYTNLLSLLSSKGSMISEAKEECFAWHFRRQECELSIHNIWCKLAKLDKLPEEINRSELGTAALEQSNSQRKCFWALFIVPVLCEKESRESLALQCGLCGRTRVSPKCAVTCLFTFDRIFLVIFAVLPSTHQIIDCAFFPLFLCRRRYQFVIALVYQRISSCCRQQHTCKCQSTLQMFAIQTHSDFTSV